jgi:hypothetical protein
MVRPEGGHLPSGGDRGGHCRGSAVRRDGRRRAGVACCSRGCPLRQVSADCRGVRKVCPVGAGSDASVRPPCATLVGLTSAAEQIAPIPVCRTRLREQACGRPQCPSPVCSGRAGWCPPQAAAVSGAAARTATRSVRCPRCAGAAAGHPDGALRCGHGPSRRTSVATGSPWLPVAVRWWAAANCQLAGGIQLRQLGCP